MTTLADKVLDVNAALVAAAIPHAFGGALALAFHVQEPRATRDIDLNIFLPPESAESVFRVLPSEVAWSEADVAAIADAGQVRLFWEETPIDLFFSTHVFHDQASSGTSEVPFAGGTIPILGATGLAVFKAFFNRTKDWADIEAMVDAGSLDLHPVIGWLVDLMGGDDERVARLQLLLHRPASPAEPRFDPPS
jgi:hypothetical protein